MIDNTIKIHLSSIVKTKYLLHFALQNVVITINQKIVLSTKKIECIS